MIEPGRPVEDISIGRGTGIGEIFDGLSRSGGFESVNMALGLDVLHSMASDDKCLRFLSFVGALVSTGARGIIRDMLGGKMFDVVVTTCGALDHDIARSYSEYREGSFTMDDSELVGAGMHRLGSVLVPLESYGPLIERKMQAFLEEEYAKGTRRMSTADITRMIGLHTGEDSFLHKAAGHGIPVVVPGIMDGAVGSQIWMFTQKHSDFVLDVSADSELLSGLVFKAERSGALMLGGGISKHHTLWWNQYRGGLDYALYMATADEHDGSLSGAPVREAISWGKVAPGARQVTLRAEITSVLPFIYAALLERLQ
ncbi:deoxyhypusine synthase [Cenarchaeum symbiosum A]|uniref:Deoxyhypusine synthase n=1 Tax=Cenarchaeum symbiosum (strain A) TaxID=414004 RepID=A0RUJ9_CENSY|nr:deoxyhypusine synthase [Cenarchaeum symbiosum A]